MLVKSDGEAPKFQAVTRDNIVKSPVWSRLTPELQEVVKVVSAVFPFRANSYIVNELIDWSCVPDDPIYQLTFPQKGMLRGDDYDRIARLVAGGAPAAAISQEADQIRSRLSPHPAGQLTHNRPYLDGKRLDGMQHKYRETVLFFPSQGQTCHAYCSFCFRWAQFVGTPDLKFASREADELVRYLRTHPEVTDVLFTGGDPMIMKTRHLARYIEPVLELEHIQNVRIGTKAVSYWPHRFVTDADADDVLRLFERVVAAGRQLALMAHYNHPVELAPPIAREALKRIRSTGANIRMQAPLIRHINDDADAWAELWRTGVRLGAIPYYMFVERDTGARHYFEVPLARAWEIYREAYRQVSGLARTVRGPSMSAFPGKIRVLGISEVKGTRVFILEYLQARDPDLVRRPFFAKFDPEATWFDQLEPAFPADQHYFVEQPADAVNELVELGV